MAQIKTIPEKQLLINSEEIGTGGVILIKPLFLLKTKNINLIPLKFDSLECFGSWRIQRRFINVIMKTRQ